MPVQGFRDQEAEAELTASLCLVRRIVGSTTAHGAKKGIIDGLWRGDVKCVGPHAKDADLWTSIWEEAHRIHQEGNCQKSSM